MVDLPSAARAYVPDAPYGDSVVNDWAISPSHGTVHQSLTEASATPILR